jgi:hypothetical protein
MHVHFLPWLQAVQYYGSASGYPLALTLSRDSLSTRSGPHTPPVGSSHIGKVYSHSGEATHSGPGDSCSRCSALSRCCVAAIRSGCLALSWRKGALSLALGCVDLQWHAPTRRRLSGHLGAASRLGARDLSRRGAVSVPRVPCVAPALVAVSSRRPSSLSTQVSNASGSAVAAFTATPMSSIPVVSLGGHVRRSPADGTPLGLCVSFRRQLSWVRQPLRYSLPGGQAQWC